MKIQNDLGGVPSPVSGDVGPSKLGRKEQPAAPAPETRTPEPDSVTTSGVSKHLETDPARELRIERLREAVQSGTYSVSAQELSAKIIDAHLGDVTRRS
jgi:anti-sigma28 factor (negative regulator of flagellin synthesis)